MSELRLIKFDKLKMAALQAAMAFVFAFCLPSLMGDPLPMRMRLMLGFVGAIMFAAGSLVFSAYLLASTLDGNYVENAFRAFGQGRVDINRAILSNSAHPLMFRLFDEQAHSTARLPRPFWSDNPELVSEILLRVKNRRTNV